MLTAMMSPPGEWTELEKLVWLRGNYAARNTGTELTVSGTPPLSLPKSLGKPLKAWEVDVIPKQDLHGYTNPWPAGGGKNKCPDVIYQQSSSAVYLGQGNATDFPFALIGGQTYTLSYASTVGGKTCYLREENEASGINIGNGTTITFTPSVTGNYRIALSANNILASMFSDVQLESGSTASAFEPYSNICPIHGTDKLTIYTDSKYGGLVEWNQIYISPYSRTGSGITITRNSFDDPYLRIDGTATAIVYVWLSDMQNSIAGHVYFVDRDSTDTGFYIYNDGGGISTGSNQSVVQTATDSKRFYVRISNGATFDNFSCRPMICDLTQMFGAGNEPTTVEEFRALFPLDYYAYNAGQQMTVDQVNGAQYEPTVIDVPTLSANQWDEEWVNGRWAGNNGVFNPAFTTYVASKNKIPVLPNTTYYFTISNNVLSSREIVWYDADGEWISDAENFYQNSTITSPSNAYFMAFNLGGAYGSTYNHDIAINYPSTVTTYNPFNNTVYTGTIGSEGGESRDAVYEFDENLPWATWGVNNLVQGITGFYFYRANTPTIDFTNINVAVSTNWLPINNRIWGGGAVGYYTNNTSANHDAWYEMVGIENSVAGIEDTDTAQQAVDKFKAYLTNNPLQVRFSLMTQTTFSVPSATIPTPTGTATTWATAEDGTVDEMSVTYVGRA